MWGIHKIFDSHGGKVACKQAFLASNSPSARLSGLTAALSVHDSAASRWAPFLCQLENGGSALSCPRETPNKWACSHYRLNAEKRALIFMLAASSTYMYSFCIFLLILTAIYKTWSHFTTKKTIVQESAKDWGSKLFIRRYNMVIMSAKLGWNVLFCFPRP